MSLQKMSIQVTLKILRPKRSLLMDYDRGKLYIDYEQNYALWWTMTEEKYTISKKSIIAIYQQTASRDLTSLGPMNVQSLQLLPEYRDRNTPPPPTPPSVAERIPEKQKLSTGLAQPR